jgi:RNA polymerase sigma-70 factor (ECF subfamily)
MTGRNRIRTFGSHQLFEHAFKQLHAPLYFYALKFIDDREVAKDLVQDAFLSILNGKQNKEIENLKAYLYRSVRNNCLNYIKHIEVKNEVEQKLQDQKNREIQFYDSQLTLVEKELQENLEKAIELLPDKYKIPFKLSRFEELKNSEIAKKLGIPVRTVETQIYRALKILREKF